MRRKLYLLSDSKSVVMLSYTLWKTMLSALFICRMAAGENHMEEIMIEHGVIGLDLELIEETEEAATQEPRRMQIVSLRRYCNYPVPGGLWFICK